MGKAGCMLISWGIESGQRADPQEGAQGLPAGAGARARCTGRTRPASRTGATSSSACPARRKRRSRQTIAFAKALPLDIALFHVAAPYPGTPFFFEVVENGWFRPGTQWEEVDMDQVHRARLGRILRGGAGTGPRQRCGESAASARSNSQGANMVPPRVISRRRWLLRHGSEPRANCWRELMPSTVSTELAARNCWRAVKLAQSQLSGRLLVVRTYRRSRACTSTCRGAQAVAVVLLGPSDSERKERSVRP